MPTKKDFAEYILDQVDDERARVRAMFGEYALYYDDVVVALLCDSTVYAKITEGSTAILVDNETGPAYPGAKPSYIVTEEQIEEKDFLSELFEAITEDLPKKKKKK
jgi:TfoX/Sxy family transcriptional regulator of competence genes